MKIVDKEIVNIVGVVASTGSKALLNRLSELEKEKDILEESLGNINNEIGSKTLGIKDIKKLFAKAKKMFLQGTLSTNKKLIDAFVDKVIIYRDRIEIHFNLDIDPNKPPNKTRKDNDNPSEFIYFENHLSDILTVVESRKDTKKQNP